MIKLLRYIRRNVLSQNKYTTYFLYAIGEILLIIIGILIALQISNQNEERKERVEERIILEGIEDDFIETRNRIKETIRSQEATLNYSRRLVNMIENKEIDTDLDTVILCIGFGAQSYWRAEPVTGTYDALIGSGNISIIQDKELLKALADFSSVSNLPFEDESASLDLLQLIEESIAEYGGVLEGEGLRNILEMTHRYSALEKRQVILKLFENKPFLSYLMSKTALELNRLARHKSLLSAANAVLLSIGEEEMRFAQSNLGKYIGQYQNKSTGNLQITLEGQVLSGQLAPYPPFELIMSSSDQFYCSFGNAKIHFEVENEKVIGLSLIHNGIEDRYVRKSQ